MFRQVCGWSGVAERKDQGSGCNAGHGRDRDVLGCPRAPTRLLVGLEVVGDEFQRRLFNSWITCYGCAFCEFASAENPSFRVGSAQLAGYPMGANAYEQPPANLECSHRVRQLLSGSQNAGIAP